MGHEVEDWWETLCDVLSRLCVLDFPRLCGMGVVLLWDVCSEGVEQVNW